MVVFRVPVESWRDTTGERAPLGEDFGEYCSTLLRNCSPIIILRLYFIAPSPLQVMWVLTWSTRKTDENYSSGTTGTPVHRHAADARPDLRSSDSWTAARSHGLSRKALFVLAICQTCFPSRTERSRLFEATLLHTAVMRVALVADGDYILEALSTSYTCRVKNWTPWVGRRNQCGYATSILAFSTCFSFYWYLG